MKLGWSRRRVIDALRAWTALAVCMALLAGISAVWGDRNIIQLVTDFFILAAMVVALQAFLGNSGIVSFGNLAFFATGAYTTALLTIPPDIKTDILPQLPPFLLQVQLGLFPAVLGAAVAAGLLALITGFVFTRMPANAMAMATLALLIMVHTTVNSWDAVTRGTIGIFGIPATVTLTGSVIGLIVISGIALLYKASSTGLHLLATREEPLAAQSLGVDVRYTRLIGWIVGAVLMGAGGSLWAQSVTAFGPASFFFKDTFNMIAMLVIGGQASVTGAVAGCLVVTIVSELLRPLESGLLVGTVMLPELNGIVQFAVAILIIIVLIWRPAGLLGGWELTLPNRWWLKRSRKAKPA